MSRELIYVVDDEVNIQQLIKYNLEDKGYRVVTFNSGEDLIDEIKTSLPDLFLIDIMLPGMDGFEICRTLKQSSVAKNIPIIMITARGDEFDRVLGLEMGSDDYITKPFSVRELVARVKAVFRRTTGNNNQANAVDIIKHGDITLDLSRREVLIDGKAVEMPYKEFELLKLLMINKGKVLTREALLDEIWGYDYYGETRTVDVHIRYLRQKIERDDENPVLIETIRGVGYKFSDKQVYIAK